MLSERIPGAVLTKLDCMLEGVQRSHCKDRTPAECAKNSKQPDLDKRVIKGLPSSQLRMDELVSPHYQQTKGRNLKSHD